MNKARMRPLFIIFCIFFFVRPSLKNMKDHKVFAQNYYATSSPGLFGSYFTLGILIISNLIANLIIICAATKAAADTTVQAEDTVSTLLTEH